MSELNWTALWVFLSAVSLMLAYGAPRKGWNKSAMCSLVAFLIFGSLAALTWGV